MHRWAKFHDSTIYSCMRSIRSKMANSKKKLAEKYGVEGLVNITRPLGVVFRIHQSGPISWCVPKLAGKWWWILFQDQGFLRGQFKRRHASHIF